MFNLFKKKTKQTVSFSDFEKKIIKLKTELGASHHVIYLEKSAHNEGVTFKAYLDNPPRFHDGVTIEEVVEKFMTEKETKEYPVKEVLINE